MQRFVCTCACSALFSAAALADINFNDFSNIGGLALVGSSAQVGDVLRLAPSDSAPHAGAAWFSTRQAISGGFDTTFTFRMSSAGGNNDGFQTGADGLAFLVQDAGGAALGGPGGGIGYDGIPRSIAIEFDSWFNAFDPDSNHVGVLSRGTNPNSADHGLAGLGVAHVDGDFYDGATRTARVQYGGGQLAVYLDDLDNPLISVGVNLDSLLGLSDGAAYVGFTSSTFASWGNHDVLNWSFTVVPEPSTARALLFGIALTRRARRWPRFQRHASGSA